MSKPDKSDQRRSRAAETRTTERSKQPVRKGKVVENRDAPFHGALHSEHPRDPFRDLFGSSSMKFEF